MANMTADTREPVEDTIDLRDDVIALSSQVREAAATATELWRDSLDDPDLMLRLIEVGHSLQRAALALDGIAYIG